MTQRTSGPGEVLLRLEHIVKHFPISHAIFPDREPLGDTPRVARSSP